MHCTPDKHLQRQSRLPGYGPVLLVLGNLQSRRIRALFLHFTVSHQRHPPSPAPRLAESAQGEMHTMDDRSFENLIRFAAGGTSRRGSMMTLGAAGLAAIFAGSFTSEAKNKGGKKKKQRPAPPPPASPPPPDLCAPQVEECSAVVTSLCNGDPKCVDAPACCSFLGTCNASGFLSCFLAALDT